MMVTCPFCPKECKEQRYLDRHIELKHPTRFSGEISTEYLESTPVAIPMSAAILPDLRQKARLGAGQRSIKMLRPQCSLCGGENAPKNWAEGCKHDPYVTAVPRSTTVPKYEDLPDGRKRVIGQEEIVEFFARPNWVQVALSPRLNRGRGYQRARNKGFIMPADLRSPAYPNGIAPVCQFRGCFWQQGLREYRQGVFCREDEARLVHYDAEGRVLEYANDLDPASQGKRAGMLMEVAV